jgi:hypothetical protein
MNTPKIKYQGFDGHIILICKCWYDSKVTISLIKKLKLVWAIRCGYEYKEEDNSCLQHIANSLYKILFPTIKSHLIFQEKLHHHLVSWRIKELTPIEKLIYFYGAELSFLRIKERTENGKYNTLIELPKPNKRVFNRIFNGNGRYSDYYLIEPKK